MKKRAGGDFTAEAVRLIKSIPRGKVATYGQIAHMTGLYPSGCRVVWILHSLSEKEGLPWHCVTNRNKHFFNRVSFLVDNFSQLDIL